MSDESTLRMEAEETEDWKISVSQDLLDIDPSQRGFGEEEDNDVSTDITSIQEGIDDDSEVGCIQSICEGVGNDNSVGTGIDSFNESIEDYNKGETVRKGLYLRWVILIYH